MAVEQNEASTWDYTCDKPAGCGADGAPFRSTGWTRKADAEARGKQHAAEHDSGEVMPDLDTFRASRGRAPDATVAG